MDSLDISLHESILQALAINLGHSKSPAAAEDADDVFTSRVELALEDSSAGSNDEKIPMSSSLVHVNASFAKFCSLLPPDHPQTSHNISLLLSLLKDIPRMDFERGLSWSDWALPDSLTFDVVAALVKIAADSKDAKIQEQVLDELSAFAVIIGKDFEAGSAVDVVLHSVPIFNGLYRSLTSTPYSYTLPKSSKIAKSLNSLVVPTTISRLNTLLLDPSSLASPSTPSDDDVTRRKQYANCLLDRYRARDRPLSGNFVICAVLEIQWTVLAIVLCPQPIEPSMKDINHEAEATNAAWAELLAAPARPIPDTPDSDHDQLKHIFKVAMRCFGDLSGTLQKLHSDPQADLYAYEVMSESLKLSTLCSVALGHPDPTLISQIKGLLSENAPVYEAIVQEAALQALVILVRNFPVLAHTMAVHLRRFASCPLPLFDEEHGNGREGSIVLHATAKCLAVCIDLAPGDDLVTSTMYSLLNYVTGSGAKENGYAISVKSGAAGPINGSSAIGTTLGTRTIEQQRRINASAITVVTRLAVEYKRDETTRLTISMLLQRLRTADAGIEALIVANLSDLGLISAHPEFLEIIKAFSIVSRAGNPEDPVMSRQAVLAAQTRLAMGLKGKTELCDAYLVELLEMFADRGTQIQLLASKEKKDTTDLAVRELTAQLAGLILPIDAILQHEGFDPHHSPTSELVALFRNMWFMCTVLGIQSQGKEWEKAALERVALKTPSLVLESALDYVSSDLEYNSILTKDFSHIVLTKQRSLLSQDIPAHSTEVVRLSLPQVTLLRTILSVEGYRTKNGYPSSLLAYFSNESINSSALFRPLEAIAEKLVTIFKQRLSVMALANDTPASISNELVNILVGCTHRFTKVREVSFSYLNRILLEFPTMLCEQSFIFALLETLTLLRGSCEEEYTDEYSPTYQHSSKKVKLTLVLTDNFVTRNEITSRLYKFANTWMTSALSKSPIELQTILQRYLGESRDVLLPDSVELGAGMAMHYAKVISNADRKEILTPNFGGWPSDSSNLLASQFAAKNFFDGEHTGFRHAYEQGLKNFQMSAAESATLAEITALKGQLLETLNAIDSKESTLKVPELRRLLFRGTSVLVSAHEIDSDILYYLVAIPVRSFSPMSVAAGVDAWTWLVSERPSVELQLLSEVVDAWNWTIQNHKGLFSKSMNPHNPFEQPIEYTPSEKETLDQSLAAAQRLLAPHLLLLQVLASRFETVKMRDQGLVLAFIRVISRSCTAFKSMSTHPLAREARFTILLFGLGILKSSRLEAIVEIRFRDRLYEAALSWFSARPQWSYGSNRVQVTAEIKMLQDVTAALRSDSVLLQKFTSSLDIPRDRRPVPGTPSLASYKIKHAERSHLLELLVDNEIARLTVWMNPLNEANRFHGASLMRATDNWNRVIKTAWAVEPAIAVHMVERFKLPALTSEVIKYVQSHPEDVVHVPEALQFLLGNRLEPSVLKSLHLLSTWAPVPPITAISYFQPKYGNNPIILQYAMRVLESHPVGLTFFFIPQVVQALRFDALGYVERFILETSKVSQLFCHQIIWNMKANCFRGDEGVEADPMKPTLDRMIENIVRDLSGDAREFYEREFSFFNEVTDISGKLKPYIKKTKPEKKAKIDEEMAKIVVDEGVYLPSNPDGVVVDMDRKSGRPLTSHAKAPFMATFKVRKEKTLLQIGDVEDVIGAENKTPVAKEFYDVWQSAIFKVGDDCRQDVLALQVIAMFKNVFNSLGLVLYLYPYRVTATAPGCGVIDVVPNATSRDEMGRQKINDLSSFFIDKYGSVDTVAYQKARMNFIQSMAAYSIACYILQIKDRHNGNIMIDGAGHIVHIDFGFLFDIGPGGVKFEPNSFKLNHEMVVLMGGPDSQGYRMFKELTVKAFLAIRPHADQLIDTVHLMLETGFPSFKGEPTIDRLRDRFKLELTEREAADYMMTVIHNAYQNFRSTAYDKFQNLQGGIPYNKTGYIM